MSAPRTAVPAGTASIQLAGPTVLAAALSAIYLVAAARLLGPAQFSDLTVCLALSYVGLLCLGPLNLTLIRFSAVYESGGGAAQVRPLVQRAARLYAPWIAAAVVLSMVLARPIAAALNLATTALVPWTGALVALGIALGGARAVALGLNRHDLYSGSVLLDALVRLATGIALAMAYRTAGSALAGFLVGTATALIVSSVLTTRLLPAARAPWTESAEMSRFMVLALVFSALVAASQNLDMIIAKVRLSPADAGDYAIAISVARGFLLLAAPFAAVAISRRPVTRGLTGAWQQVVQVPVAAYLAVSAPVLLALALAPAPILSLLFGAHSPSQVQFVPILALAFTTAGVFLVIAHGEIRAGRFSFLLPVAVTIAAELVVLSVVPATPMAIAWTVLAGQGLAVGSVLGAPRLTALLRPFEGSAKYWDDRYARGGASGDGSIGKFAQFKAEILNDFVERHRVTSVVEWGCGDGQQLSLARYPVYQGLDVSPGAIQLCRTRFAGDASKTFATVADYDGRRADLALSLDVIYHLVEDAVFDEYMRRLFDSSAHWVIVYASNHDETDRAEAAHVRHRQFTRWVSAHRPEWVLRTNIPNRYPYSGDFRLGSFSEFFIFERT